MRRSRRFEAGKGHGGFITRGYKVVSPILSLHQNWLCHALPGFMMIYNDLYYFYCIQLFIYTYIYIYLFIELFIIQSVFIYCLCRGGITFWTCSCFVTLTIKASAILRMPRPRMSSAAASIRAAGGRGRPWREHPLA